MKGIKRIVLTMALIISTLMLCGVASAAPPATEELANVAPLAAATWTEDCEVYVPGWNGSGYTKNTMLKRTVTLTASFKATSKQPNNFVDARLINSNNEARSQWARDLPVGKICYAAENGAKVGYEYRAELSSDLISTAFTVHLDFSADNLK